jgi:acyl-CoA synthetase (AMP-forming)/AMP-acid ligase II
MTRTLATLLDEAASAAGDHDFIRTESGTRTNAEMAEPSRRIAAGLAALGLRSGDRVAIAAPNGAEWLEFFYGALRLGLVVVTLNVRYRESELDYMLNQSGARLVLTAAGGTDLRAFYRDFRPRIPTVEHLFVLDNGAVDSYETLLVDDRRGTSTAAAADDPAVIPYTSGTTGAPKGAVLTHRSIIASAEAQAQRVTPTRRTCCSA